MGNSLGGRRRRAKIMKVDGETFKIKTPIIVQEVIKDYPNHVLIESEAVKHFGIRAKPLQSHQQLNPKRLYFLVELPKVTEERVPRRVRSGINMTAKDRLETLKLSRRSISDLTILNSKNFILDETEEVSGSTVRRIKLRLPKSQVEKLVEDSKDGIEAAEKIMDLCIGNNGNSNGNGSSKGKEIYEEISHWKPSLGRVEERFMKV